MSSWSADCVASSSNSMKSVQCSPPIAHVCTAVGMMMPSYNGQTVVSRAPISTTTAETDEYNSTESGLASSGKPSRSLSGECSAWWASAANDASL